MTQPIPPELLAMLQAEELQLPFPPEGGVPLPEGAGLPSEVAGLPPEGAPLPPPLPEEPLPEEPLPPEEGATAEPGIPLDEEDDDRPVPEEVDYRWSDSCATCGQFMPPESCKVVNGHVRPDGVCTEFGPVLGIPDDPIYGDDL